MAQKLKKSEMNVIAKTYGRKTAYRVNLGNYSVIVISNTKKPRNKAALLDQLKSGKNVVLRGKDLIKLSDAQKRYAARRYLSTFSEKEKKAYYKKNVPTKISMEEEIVKGRAPKVAKKKVREMSFTLVVTPKKRKIVGKKKHKPMKEKVGKAGILGVLSKRPELIAIEETKKTVKKKKKTG